MSIKPEIVLIFQIGSMGDTVISMPSYREIARRHPNATRYLLTNFPIGSKMVAAEAILAPTGLISGSVEYPMPLRGGRAIATLYRRITALAPQTLYYLTPETKLLNLIRHYSFFRMCGISAIRGVPWSKDLRYPRKLADSSIWESEASRLLRCIGGHTEPGPPPNIDRDLCLTNTEKNKAEAALRESIGSASFIAVSVGGKVPVNNWGDYKWSQLLSEINQENPGLAVLFVGSADERHRNQKLAESWHGPAFNSCGRFSPRETASLLSFARLFIGHDTGTLHLAAAAGTPVIGVYSARNVPGKWYSDRATDTFFYNKTECFGCEYVEVAECAHNRKCIADISSESVMAEVRARLRYSQLIHLGT